MFGYALQEATLSVTVPGCWVTKLAGGDRRIRIVDRKAHGKRFMESLIEVRRTGSGESWETLLADAKRGTAITRFKSVASDEKSLLGIVQCKDCNSCRVLLASKCFVASASSTDGTLQWTVRFSERRELSKLMAALRKANADAEIVRITPVRSDSSLTMRQAEVLALAWQMGYFEFPKRSGVEDVAKRLGLAKSTVSETLHRAERKVLESYLSGRR